MSKWRRAYSPLVAIALCAYVLHALVTDPTPLTRADLPALVLAMLGIAVSITALHGLTSHT